MSKTAMKHQKSSIIISSIAILILATNLAQAAAAGPNLDNHDDNQHQPAPEPYSFSYSSDSIGGQSSHQESGDGSGRVTGFYTILGEDGRERRVDYVADENGYRATISTNEIGTRSESSADAQYNVRLPGEKQLEAAKVTLEQYKFLEETHANERQLQLSRLSSNRQQQQQQQQSSRQQASFQSGSFGNSFSQNNNNQATGSSSFQASNQKFAGQQQLHGQQQHLAGVNHQQQADLAISSSAGGSSLGIDSTGSAADIDSDWRQRDSNGARVASQKFTASGSGASWSQGKLRSPPQQPQQPQQQPSFAGQSESSFSSSSQATAPLASGPGSSAQLSVEAANQQQQQLTDSSGNQQRLDGTQQVQAAAWQMANRGAVPARKQTTILQRQMDLQFMQQLSDQDYPRQTINQQATQLTNANTQQRQQFNLQHQPTTASQLNGQFTSFATNNQQVAGSIGGDRLDQQLQQQQNNIIDETPEQPDSGVAFVNQGAGDGQTNEQFASITSTQPSISNIQKQQQQQQQVAYRPSGINNSFTANTQTAPAGFVAINLNKDETSSQQTDGNLEVDQRPATTQGGSIQSSQVQFGSNQSADRETSSGASQQTVQDQEVVQTTQTGAGGGQYEQTNTGGFGSINQIIQSQQVKGQQQEAFVPSSTPATIQFRPTTVAAPIQTTSFERVEVATKLSAPSVETTTARQVYVQPSTTTSTTTTEQPQAEVTYEQNRPTAPIKEVSTNVGATRFRQQQQVKGGSRVQLNRFDRPNVNHGFSPIKTNQLSAWQTTAAAATTTTPKPQQETINLGAVAQIDNQRQQTTYYSTGQPEVIQAPFKTQTIAEEISRQPVVVATSGYQQANAVGQQQQLTSNNNQWQQQPIVTTQLPAVRPSRVEVQSQQQQQQHLKGTKGGALRRKQQFWQQASASRVQQQQQPQVDTNQMSNFPIYGARLM